MLGACLAFGAVIIPKTIKQKILTKLISMLLTFYCVDMKSLQPYIAH